MMPLVVDAFVNVLATSSPPVLPAGRAGSRRPTAPGDLPAAVISVAVEGARQRWPRDPDRDRYGGTLTVDVWGSSAADTESIARKLQERIHDSPVDLRHNGFAYCLPSTLDAVEDVRQQPATGSAFTAYRQRVAFRFAFESTLVAVENDGGSIKQIDVGVVRHDGEAMRIT